MSFEEPNDPRSSEIVNNPIQLTELATYEERAPGVLNVILNNSLITLALKTSQNNSLIIFLLVYLFAV